MANHAFAVKFSGQVDKNAGVVRGVSVITEGIAKGWNEQIDAITLAQVMACAKEFDGGLKVVDRHTRGTDSIFATAGTLRNFRIEDNKLRADLHILATEPNRDKLLEMAETMPDTFGLSIAFSGPSETRDGKAYARCVEIYNAALVDVPAANPSGLFAAKFENGVGVAVDASDKVYSSTIVPMTPEEILKQCEAKIAASVTEMAARLKKCEDLLSVHATEMAAADTTIKELSAKHNEAVKELTAKIGDDTKKLELTAQMVAKEFAKHTGQSGCVTSDGAGSNSGTEPTEGQKFVAQVLKEFSTTKSQSKSLDAVITANPNGYKAFRAENLPIKWA